MCGEVSRRDGDKPVGSVSGDPSDETTQQIFISKGVYSDGVQ